MSHVPPLPWPMPADFAVRLAGGLAAMLLIASPRAIPPAFFRTHCLVMLGLLVGASLFAGTVVSPFVLAATITAAVLAYLASAMWGLGLPRVGWPLTALVASVCLGLML